jgi:hypothetical protein
MDHRTHVAVDAEDLSGSLRQQGSAESLTGPEVEDSSPSPQGGDQTVAVKVTDNSRGIGVPGDTPVSRSPAQLVAVSEAVAGWRKADVCRP